MAVISSLLIRLSTTSTGVEKGFKKAGEAVDRFERKINQTSAAFTRLGRGMTAIGIGPGLVAATGAVVSLGGAVLPAVNNVLLMPAALAQVAAAGIVVKMGMSGVGDAVKAVASGSKDAAEKLALLPPGARTVAKDVGEMSKVLTKSTQQALFTGWTGEFDKLVKQQTPALQKGFTGIAASMGGVMKQAVAAAGTPLFSGALAQVFSDTAAATDTLAAGTPGLVAGFAQLVAVGSPYIRQLTQSAIKSLALKAAWLGTAEGAMWLHAKIDQGLDVMGRLLSITGHLGSSLLGLFAGSQKSAGDLLGRIDALTARMDAWVHSAEGQEKIVAFFDKARLLGGEMGDALTRVFDAAVKLSNAFNTLPQPLQDTLLQFSAYGLVLGPLITRFSSVIAILFQISTAAVKATWGIWKWLFVNETAAGGTRAAWIAARISAIGSWVAMQAAAAVRAVQIGVIWTARWVQQAATSAAFTGLMYAYAAANWVRMAAAATVNAARTGAVWAATWIAQQARAIASIAVTVATVVAGWVLMAAQSLMQAARMAAAWLIAMGPVGIVIAIVVALVVLIIKNWDTIVAWTQKAWNWIWEAIKFVAGAIMDYIRWWVGNFLAAWNFISELPGRVRGWVLAAHQAIVDKVGDILSFMRALPGRVWDALKSAGTNFAQWGRDVVQGIINGLGDMVGRLVDKAREVASSAMKAIKSALGIGSPSKITYQDAIYVGQGAIKGLDKIKSPVVAAAEELANAAMDPWAKLGFKTAALQVSMSQPMPTTPVSDDDSRPPGNGALVSIGTFNAGGMAPDEVATALERKRRSS